MKNSGSIIDPHFIWIIVICQNSVQISVIIEIDQMVVDASKEFLPGIGTAWDDPRLEVRFIDGHEYVERSTDEKYDVILLDITMPGLNGLEVANRVAKESPKTRVLILSMHDQFLYAERALHAGARGYIMKQEAMEKVVTAIRQVLAGKIYLNEKVKDQILFNLADRPAGNGRSPMERLTDRELEVFRMIGKGFSTREIASNLHLSIKTIGTYRERIKEKLNLKHANELVRHAVHWGKTGKVPDEAPDS